ncbi:hypothetical protein ABW21_db0208019 [Orbilia brochopaga]|nr:hypothetical protein ABW21_db0208019 [Drechslerella brochopaga]
MAAPRPYSTPRARGFAPLNPELRAASSSAHPELLGVVFDVDGTLCMPQSWMFAEMRRQLGISKATDILNHILTLPDDAQVDEQGQESPSQREAAYDRIRAVEREAMGQMRPQEGLVELMEYLDRREIKKAICTRNFDAPVEHLITNFIPGHKFYPIITRDFKPPKPDPAGILHIAEKLGVDESGLIMVGDSLDDMTAGRRAGAVTVLLANVENETLKFHEHTDLSVDR